MPTVSTANVNGVRAATGKGLLDWLAASDADVVCLQEVRARPEEIPDALTGLLSELGLYLTVVPSETAKGRNGVAVLSRSEPLAVRTGFGDPETDPEGRYVEVDLPDLTVASLYLPKGVTGTAKQERKDRFLERFAPYLDRARQRARDDGREMVVCGDWNLAPTEADVRNWRSNRTNSGFLPHERDWWAGLLARGWVDVVRSVYPDVDGSLLVVDLPRPGVRQRRRMADRPPAGDTGPGGAGQGRRRRPGAVARPRGGRTTRRSPSGTRRTESRRSRDEAAALSPGGRGTKQRH